MRIGIGYDIHNLINRRRLIIGGVEIPYKKGLLGHSDGDVLIHSIIDAILGAAGLGDIGEYFPDSDKKYKDISSLYLLEETYKILRKKKFKINNIDSIIIAEEPKLYKHKDIMRKKISDVLKISKEKINIKAKTNEGQGLVGKGKAIVSISFVSILKP